MSDLIEYKNKKLLGEVEFLVEAIESIVNKNKVSVITIALAECFANFLSRIDEPENDTMINQIELFDRWLDDRLSKIGIHRS